ncbi:Six-hairpin glycosidase [Dacryopinax primogenitus]|uniref:Six-hairpin glycosidase n=1 Tax=Dacryopinax primogenitus (strain DJM 731) TaxID=1858805 RepID=M5FYD1_DACPD|nr:Six-hairpin glycosidase [Dacryopinax primogenitus]EJU00845.1 Six-hairpin glycosidase [Dacryopinax primogenitus]
MTCLLTFALASALSAQFVATQTVPSELYSPIIAQKLLKTAQSQSIANSYPQYTYPGGNGSWDLFTADTWTSAFFSGELYLLNQRFTTLCPGNSANIDGTNWIAEGMDWSEGLAGLTASNTLGHDVGFISQPFRDDVALNFANSTALDIVQGFNADLSARFSPIVGCTKSWDGPTDNDFEVIMDNMQNLVLFLFTASLTGNQTLVDMAMSHANKTIENHVRDDGSSFHVVDYDPTTGGVQWRGTAQGYSNSSTWSRGQAWGIYGFATMYNFTRVQTYLDTSRCMADYFVSNLPEAGVPYWDFNAPLSPPPSYDTSAATIAASALLFLSSMEAQQSPANTSGAQHWQQAAISLLSSTVQLAWQPGGDWDSLLSNGTVNNRATPPNNNTGVIYGDYYFIEAGNRLVELGLVDCSGAVLNGTSGNSTGPSGGSGTGSGSGPSPSGPANSAAIGPQTSLLSAGILGILVVVVALMSLYDTAGIMAWSRGKTEIMD